MVTLCLQNLQKGGNVGIDPCCISVDTAHRWEQAFSKYGQRLVPLKENLVDKIWESRPPHIVAPVCIQPLEFTGRSAKEKISDLREKLCQEKANAIVVTTLDEVILVGWVH
jgi:Xaa-Pro aminopeptidase